MISSKFSKNLKIANKALELMMDDPALDRQLQPEAVLDTSID